MLEVIKRIMGLKKSRRPALDLAKLNSPVEAARQRLEAAQSAHTATDGKYREHADTLSIAKAAFETRGDDETADRVVDLSRAAARHDLFKSRALRAVERAAAALTEAEAARDAAALQALDSVYTNACKHMIAEWEATGKPALLVFAACIREIDTIASEAEHAVREASALRGDDNAWMKVRQLEAYQAVLGDVIVRELGYPTAERLARVLRF